MNYIFQTALPLQRVLLSAFRATDVRFDRHTCATCFNYFIRHHHRMDNKQLFYKFVLK